MLALTFLNTSLLALILYRVYKVEKLVSEMHSSMDGIKRLLIAIFTKARKNKQSEVS